MKFDDFNRILLSAAFLLLGAFLTAVRAKLVATKQKNNLHLIFYTVSIVLSISAIIGTFVYRHSLFLTVGSADNKEIEPNWIGIITILFALTSSILLFRFTKKHLAGKFHYNANELAPKVNEFTKNSDKKNIRLLAGDLNFFGNAPSDMDKDAQYTCLKNENFRLIQILCFRPIDNTQKIRYGKLLSDMNAEIRYYNPNEADLNVRGRMKTLGNVTYLLIYNKIRSGVYEALELNTADEKGALYDHIWSLIWSLAEPSTALEIQEYKNLYKG